MDPQTTWDQLLEAYGRHDWPLVDELAATLIDWLGRGGFPPRAVTGSDLGADWDLAVSLAACRFARQRAGKEARHAAP